MDGILEQHHMHQSYTEILLSAGLTASSVTAGLEFDREAMATARAEKPPPPVPADAVIEMSGDDIEILEYS